MNSANNIFQTTACLSQEELLRYVKREMTKEEMRVVELHLADCEICFDAVEGLSLTEKSRLEKIQTELQQRIQLQLQTDAKQKVIPLYKKWYSMAAAIAFLFLVSVYLVKKYREQDSTGLAETKTGQTSLPQKLENKITDETFKADSISSPVIERQNETATQNKIAEKTVVGSLANESLKQDVEKAGFKKSEISDADKTVADEKNLDVIAGDNRKENVNADNVPSVAQTIETKDEVAYKQPQPALDDKLDMRRGNSYVPNQSVEKMSKAKISSTTAAPAATGGTVTTFSNTQDQLTTSNFDFQLYDSALNYFNAKEYSNSLNSFNQILSKQPENINSNYYAGVSNYNLGNYTVAVAQLNIVANYKRNSFYESALWYKANSLLKLNNKNEAKKTLQSVVKLKGNYKLQAEELLKDL